MARVTVIFEDKPGGTVVQIESDPVFPVKGGTADLESTTPAQAMAFGAVMEVAGLAKTMDLFVQDRPVI